ncbi:Vacuolar protein sorting-associated protein [Globisporangium polare]
MFETLVTGLLTSALGNYIDPKCFSSDKINVAVWSGYVVLHALEIKPDVIAHPALNLVRGMIGSIELKIPWNRLNSDSVVVTIDDVYLLVRTEEDIERAMLEMDEFTIKKKLLEELYAQAKRQQDEGAEDDTASTSEKGFAARLVNKIIDNLELHIRRIHVRLEDYSTGDHPFSIGLAIESVHVQSTNSSWQPSYVDASKSNEPRIYKIVELNHLSVYLNPDCDVLRNQTADFERCSLDEFSSFFSRSIPKRFDDRHYQHTQMYPSNQQHHFLLKPIDAHARLIVNRDPFDNSGPKFEVDVSIPEVALRLEDSQYCDLLYLASAFQVPSHVAKYQQYKRLRPRNAVLDAEPGEWWQYAINAVVQDVRTKKQHWSWSYMKQRRDDRKKYVAAWEKQSRRLTEGHERSYLDSESEEEEEYDDDRDHERSGISESYDDDDKASLISSAGSSRASSKASGDAASTGIVAVLEEIESRRSVEDILFFRYLGDRKLLESASSSKHSNPDLSPPMPMPASAVFSDTESVDTELSESTLPTEMKYRSWGTWMFGWTSKLASSSNGLPDEAPRRVLPEVELRELFKILEYEPSKRSKRKKKNAEDFDPDASDHNVESQITVTLGKGSLTLSSDTETNKKLLRDDPSYSKKYAPTDFLLGTFSHLQLAAVAKNDAIKVDVSLQSIEAFDESAESSSFSRLLSRKQSGGGSLSEIDNATFSGPVFLMSYETNPVNSTADAALSIHMEPLEIVFSPTAACWGRLTNFTNTPKVMGLWAELEVASFNDIVNLKARTEAKLKYAMANRIALSVNLRIQAPVIIIPESDTDINCARLVVDLGLINFRTDRLSKLDGDSINVMSSSGGPLSGFGGSSLALLNPMSSPNLTSSTSFVKQLYDEAEKGEGAIRWKEEFYDKFSLSVTNIHVFLVPYGKNRQTNPAVPGPPHLRNAFNDEQEYELIERFNINVTVRTSVLPLDATLTRFYIHADLPALTFKMSLEKYFQLMCLVERFSIAVPSSTNESSPFESSLFDSTDLFEGLDANPFDQEDRFLSRRRNSFLSSSALKRFTNDEDDSTAVSTIPDTTQVDSGESDGESSTGSDDTWFSIASGNVDLNLMSLDGTDLSAGAEPFQAKLPFQSTRSTAS